MKKQITCLTVALSLAFSLSACQKPDPPAPTDTASPSPIVTPTTAPVVTPTPTGSVAADPIWSDQVFSRTFRAGDGTEVLSVTYTLPLVQNADQSPSGAAINAWYKSEGSSLLSAAEENYETAVAGYDVSTAAGLPYLPTLEEMTYTVTHQSDSISIAREYYVNSGGASPMVFRFSEQFDSSTGRQLFFADFFADPDAVVARVIDAFLALPDLAQAMQDGALSADQVDVAFQPENFYLTDSGYVFWIQGNVLAATHSYLEVSLPYDALEDLTLDGT